MSGYFVLNLQAGLANPAIWIVCIGLGALLRNSASVGPILMGGFASFLIVEFAYAGPMRRFTSNFSSSAGSHGTFEGILASFLVGAVISLVAYFAARRFIGVRVQ
jgi:hypothetical protein